MRMRPERREVAAGIDDALRDAAPAKRLDRPIDGIALGDAADIDPDPIAKADAAVGKPFDGIVAPPPDLRWRRIPRVARQQAEILQHRSDGDVEHAGGASAKVVRDVEHFQRPGMYDEGARKRRSVEATDIARLVVEAHEAMHGRHRCEGGIRGRFQLRWRCTRDGNLDKRSEQRARTAQVRARALPNRSANPDVLRYARISEVHVCPITRAIGKHTPC
jgi:hypothetical protein